MPRESAGLLLFRMNSGILQVLLIRPGGPFWQNKDLGAWSIPKGEIAPGEDRLAAARREFTEEIGSDPFGPFIPLTPIKQKSGKIVHAWAVRGDLDPAAIQSNTVTLQWPPKSGRMIEIPEADRADFFDLPTAATKINPAQSALLSELKTLLLKSAPQ